MTVIDPPAVTGFDRQLGDPEIERIDRPATPDLELVNGRRLDRPVQRPRLVLCGSLPGPRDGLLECRTEDSSQLRRVEQAGKIRWQIVTEVGGAVEQVLPPDRPLLGRGHSVQVGKVLLDHRRVRGRQRWVDRRM
jgi:hypothetical protein